MKRIISIVLCLCMTLVFCVPAMASGEPSQETGGVYASLSLENASWTQDAATGAWCLTDVSYCLNPVADVQRMNIFVPGAYMDETGAVTTQTVNGYNAATAPIIFANNVGGYSESSPSGVSGFAGYLERGYVVVSPGCRGKETLDETGAYIGKGCAGLVDLKAAVRCLKYNDAVMAGDADCIVSVGRSAGGALSALLAATGNAADYDPYLEEIGAIMTKTDDIYAAQCYCPITDYDNGSIAYEWFYNGSLSYSVGGSGELTTFQQALSDDLAAAFPAYVNGLGLADKNGNALTLDETAIWSGSYYDYMLRVLGESLAEYIEKTYSVVKTGMSAYTYIEEEKALAYIDELNANGEWVTLEFSYAQASTGPSTIVTYASGATCTVSSIQDFVENFRSRGKACPAFDKWGKGTEVYGDSQNDCLHFDVTLADILAANDYSAYDGYDAALAAEYAEAYDPAVMERVKLMNPLNYLKTGDVADYIRIRTGSSDEHASFTVSMNLALALETYTDATVDYALAWAQPHGDAEVNSEDLYAWIERVCKFERELTDEQIASVLDLDNMEYTWTLSGSGDTAYYLLSPLVDVAKPEMGAYQGCSVAIPACYVKGQNEDGSLEFDYEYEFTNPNGATYTAATAPVIINTGAAGYSAGTTGKAGGSYVSYGYINVACGNRGKSLSTVNAEGDSYFCGDAPYCLVDQKACVRWLKYNIALGNLCGDAERMISTGGSGGGAHSLMLAATGNNPDFYPYLEESGAIMRYTDETGKVVEISDAIWGCCPYSPITNLEEGNIAYEFETGLARDDSIVTRYSQFRQILSQGEAEQYMEYINAKGLTWDFDGDGVREALTIEYDEATDAWSGNFLQLFEQFMEEQLEWYLNHIDESEKEWVGDVTDYAMGYLTGAYEGSGEMSGEPSGEEGYASENDENAVTGSGEDLTEWVRYTVDENGQYDVDFDIADFEVYRGRSKTNPAFDDLDLGQAENQVFGDFDQDFKHWDQYVLAAMTEYYDELDAAYDGTDSAYETFADMYAAYQSDVESMLAGDKFGQNIVYLYNPSNYILDPETEQPAWVFLCHGSADTDASSMVVLVDAIAWDMMGVETYANWVWDDGHVAGNPLTMSLPIQVDNMVRAGF